MSKFQYSTGATRLYTKEDEEFYEMCCQCKICDGLIIDAVTINECMHSFCRTCAVHYFDTKENTCPTCNVLVHEGNPMVGIKLDRAKQEMIYKLFPREHKKEMQKRRMFYENHPEYQEQHPKAYEFDMFMENLNIPDRLMSFCLEYFHTQEPKLTKNSEYEELDLPFTKIYLRVICVMPIAVLQQLIIKKLGKDEGPDIEVLFFHCGNQLRLDATVGDVYAAYQNPYQDELTMHYAVFQRKPTLMTTAAIEAPNVSEFNDKSEDQTHMMKHVPKQNTENLTDLISGEITATKSIARLPEISTQANCNLLQQSFNFYEEDQGTEIIEAINTRVSNGKCEEEVEMPSTEDLSCTKDGSSDVTSSSRDYFLNNNSIQTIEDAILKERSSSSSMKEVAKFQPISPASSTENENGATNNVITNVAGYTVGNLSGPCGKVELAANKLSNDNENVVVNNIITTGTGFRFGNISESSAKEELIPNERRDGNENGVDNNKTTETTSPRVAIGKISGSTDKYMLAALKEVCAGETSPKRRKANTLTPTSTLEMQTRTEGSYTKTVLRKPPKRRMTKCVPIVLQRSFTSSEDEDNDNGSLPINPPMIDSNSDSKEVVFPFKCWMAHDKDEEFSEQTDQNKMSNETGETLCVVQYSLLKTETPGSNEMALNSSNNKNNVTRSRDKILYISDDEPCKELRTSQSCPQPRTKARKVSRKVSFDGFSQPVDETNVNTSTPACELTLHSDFDNNGSFLGFSPVGDYTFFSSPSYQLSSATTTPSEFNNSITNNKSISSPLKQLKNVSVTENNAHSSAVYNSAIKKRKSVTFTIPDDSSRPVAATKPGFASKSPPMITRNRTYSKACISTIQHKIKRHKTELSKIVLGKHSTPKCSSPRRRSKKPRYTLPAHEPLYKSDSKKYSTSSDRSHVTRSSTGRHPSPQAGKPSQITLKMEHGKF